jgi:hypothetical protein
MPVRTQTAVSKGFALVSYRVPDADERGSIDQVPELAWFRPDSMSQDGLPLERLDHPGVVITKRAGNGRFLRSAADPTVWR